jgi:isopentenyl phosphate kinase
MQQIQILNIYFDNQSEIYNPIYCPFTGKIIISSDPYEEIESFPSSVFAVYIIDYYDCEPQFLGSTVPDDFFSEVLSFDDIIEKLKKLGNKAFLILNVMHYGVLTGDAGGFTFILEVPYPLLN